MTEEAIPSPSLSKHPSASLKELIHLSWPLIFGLFSACFMGLCDRLFLGQCSLEAMEGSVSASYLAMLFQHPLMRLTAMTQVFVGLYYGGKQLAKIGPSIWQMIWLCLFSMVVTVPLGLFLAPLFFGGTPVEAYSSTYFSVILWVNFLFPLGTALSSYFIGQGRVRVLFLTTLLSHGLNIGLDYAFIFGIEGIIPSMGILGAALATGLSQLTFCVILFSLFLRKSDREVFGTGNYRFNWGQFVEQMRVGLPRAVARIIILTAWASISRIMTVKGGDHLLVLTVGGTLILFFAFINDGIQQGMVTIASNLMGSQNSDKIWRLVRSSLTLLALTTLALSIPYFFLSNQTLSLFPISSDPVTLSILKKTLLWLWVYHFCYGINGIGLSLIMATRDMTFYMLSIAFVWATSFIPVYFAMNLFKASPDKLWLIMAFDCLVFGLLFFYRFSSPRWKLSQLDPES